MLSSSYKTIPNRIVLFITGKEVDETSLAICFAFVIWYLVICQKRYLPDMGNENFLGRKVIGMKEVFLAKIFSGKASYKKLSL